jgi:alkanesulfonate monooxygenase SsuD/methylene tetrahydromethanopterin reductase-like flavin-dependent oxidoreductase (luciferase family)
MRQYQTDEGPTMTMSIGIDVPAAGGLDPAAAAQEAEALGFDFVSSNDHVLGSEARDEGWTHLVWLAASTRRIRIASRVLGVPYRNPALVAKMAETLDRLSGGRLILGLGAGSGDDEFRAMGLAEASVGDRITDLEDAIEILHGLWRDDTSTYQGRRLATIAARITPKPDHSIPIWLGTAGPRGLGLVGRVADGWIPSMPYVSPPNARSKIEVIHRAAERAGRDAEHLELIFNLRVAFEPGAAADLAGTPHQIAERLRGFLGLGFTGFNLQPVGRDRTAELARLAADVLPPVRQA